jgi:hypothetical protein
MDAAEPPRPAIVTPAEVKDAPAGQPPKTEPAPSETQTLQPLPALPAAAPGPAAPIGGPPPPAPPPPSSAAPSTVTIAQPVSPSRAIDDEQRLRELAMARFARATSDDEHAPLEFGLGTFLMVGGGAGSYIGVAPFLIDDVGPGVFLRPSVGVGTSLATNLPSTWTAARLDTCLRLPGRYAVRGGLQLDLCGGADVGFSYMASGTDPGTPASGQTLPFIDLGPSVDLRAEANRLAITLRAVGGFNIARQGFDDVTGARVDLPLVTWRLELDFSWVARSEEKLVQQGSL